jgi:ribosomal protein S18 acetylase RimI-like enzyme
MSAHPLHNVFWRCLNGPHLTLSTGHERARRYQPGFSPIAAFASPAQPDFDGLAALCEPGESFYVAAWDGTCPSDKWHIEFDGAMVAMAWEATAPPANTSLPCQTLGTEHLEAMLALVAQTAPGPFGPRNLSMGEFVGHFSPEGHLIAMAGERTRAEQWHEVSGVCTHPDHQGRGLGRQMTFEVVRRMLLRGETPFLHAMASNKGACRMCRQLGFGEVIETPIRVIRRR